MDAAIQWIIMIRIAIIIIVVVAVIMMIRIKICNAINMLLKYLTVVIENG